MGPEKLQGVSFRRELQAKLACGEDHVPGDQLVVHDGELRELDARHPGHGGVASLPVELDVIRRVTVCKRGHGEQGGRRDYYEWRNLWF